MKRNVMSVLSLLAIAVVLGAPRLQAQSQVKADVPFDFQAGDKAMSAGNHAVSSISEQVDLMLNADTDKAVFLIKSIYVQGAHGQRARLVFRKYGNTYFLSQIWDGRSDTGIQLSQSKREKELSLAMNREPNGPEIVIVAMK